MNKFFMRVLFALLPSVFWGLIFLMIHPAIAAFVFAGMAYIGIAITAPKPERGEVFGS